MKSLFQKGRVGFIGLDVSDGSVEAVQLQGVPGGKTYRVSGYSRVVLKPGIVKHGRIQKPDLFVESMRALFAKPVSGSIDSKHTVLSLVENQCIHNVFSLRKPLSDVALLDAVQRKLVQNLPFNLNDVLWDWQIVTEDYKNYYVHTVAVEKVVVEEYRQSFRKLGLFLDVVEPQLLSMTRLYWPNLPIEEPTLVIDIGGQAVSLGTIDDLGIHQSSVLRTGAQYWQAIIARKLKVNAAGAQKVMQAIGLRKVKHPKAEIVHEVLLDGVKQIFNDAKQHLQYYQVQDHIEPRAISNLILLGGGSFIPGMTEMLANNLKLQTQVLKPWVNFKPEWGQLDSHIYMNAIGAAIRGIKIADSRLSNINVLVTRKAPPKKKKSVFGSLFGGSKKKKVKKLSKKADKKSKNSSDQKKVAENEKKQ